MQCKVKFGNEHSTCSRTEENHGKSSQVWAVAGPSRSTMTSNQHSGIQVRESCRPSTDMQLLYVQKCTFLFDVYIPDYLTYISVTILRTYLWMFEVYISVTVWRRYLWLFYVYICDCLKYISVIVYFCGVWNCLIGWRIKSIVSYATDIYQGIYLRHLIQDYLCHFIHVLRKLKVILKGPCSCSYTASVQLFRLVSRLLYFRLSVWSSVRDCPMSVTSVIWTSKFLGG